MYVSIGLTGCRYDTNQSLTKVGLWHWKLANVNLADRSEPLDNGRSHARRHGYLCDQMPGRIRRLCHVSHDYAPIQNQTHMFARVSLAGRDPSLENKRGPAPILPIARSPRQ